MAHVSHFLTTAMLRRMLTAGNFKDTMHPKGSGCGSVGRAVASDSKGTRFESSHRLRSEKMK